MKRPSRYRSWLLSAGVTALALLCPGPVAGAEGQQSTAEDPLHGRRNYNVPPGEFYTGRSPFTGTDTAPPATPRRAPVVEQPTVSEDVPPVVPPPTDGDCQVINTDWVSMTKTMPREVVVGQEFMYLVVPRATTCLGNVVVTDQIPAGTTYLRSEPKAELVGDKLVWHLGDLDAGQSTPVKVWVRADREGELGSCATISADPRLCAKTIAARPLLTVDMTGLETAPLNSEVVYSITVANPGSAAARNVVATCDVPEGLTDASGRKQLTFPMGDLAPKQTKTIPVSLKATQRGRHCSTASAVADNVPKVSDEACTLVAQPALKIVNTGDRQQLINKAANYQLRVSNVGDVDLTDVVLNETASAPTTITTAPGATVNGNTATWTIGSLPKGSERTFNVALTAKVPGNYCNVATVVSAQGLRESAQACTDWIGVTGVLVEVVDDPDPIQVSELTTFTIRVTNQGSSRSIEEIKVRSLFAAEIDPVDASGEGVISGKSVTWPVVPALAPKTSVTYTIHAKGGKVGDHRLETQVTTRMRENPIVELESTTVY